MYSYMYCLFVYSFVFNIIYRTDYLYTELFIYIYKVLYDNTLCIRKKLMFLAFEISNFNFCVEINSKFMVFYIFVRKHYILLFSMKVYYIN